MAKRQRKKIERHLPPVGTSLTKTFNGKTYVAVVVKARDYPEGKAIRLGNDLYRSMTAAANAVTNRSTNGWTFWKIRE